MSLKPEEFSVGTSLPELKRRVTQERINQYAAASGDFNPIHIDPEFARNTQLGGTVAHGMLVLAYVSEFMMENFRQDWLNTGSLSARFKGATYPEDTVTVSGKINSIENDDDSAMINCEVHCRNQKDEPVIICNTKVRVKADEDSR